jgi:hypothetical protein
MAVTVLAPGSQSVEQHLVRELREGDVVVMDNLSSHKVSGVVEAIEAAGVPCRSVGFPANE